MGTGRNKSTPLVRRKARVLYTRGLHGPAPREAGPAQERLRLRRRTIERGLGVGPGGLAGREAEHAGVVAVVHEVRDRIDPGAAAGVTAGGATGSRRLLRGGVAHLVVARRAGPLERVVEPHPVAHLVSRRVAFVEGRRGTAGQAGVQDGDAVVVGIRS